MRQIGIVTSGGDCPGLNAVIRAVVRTAYSVHNYEVIGIYDGFTGLLNDGKTRIITPAETVSLLTLGGTILGTTNKGPFGLDENGNPLPEFLPYFEEVYNNYCNLGLKGIIVVGGDGSMRIAHALHRMGVKIVGVPKTIDNDIYATDRTFGFDTAVHIATQALDRLHTVASAHHRIMVCEVMGRDTGWIALSAGLASGADAILIPEIPFQWKSILQMISARMVRGRRHSLIVVAEGAMPFGGTKVFNEEGRLGGIGEFVGKQLEKLTKIETRVTVLGHVQRGGTPTAYDRILASRFGEAASYLVAEKKFGTMVALRGDKMVEVSLEEATQKTRSVELDNHLIRVARNTGVSLGDETED